MVLFFVIHSEIVNFITYWVTIINDLIRSKSLNLIKDTILYKYYIHKYNEDKSNKYTKQLSNQFIFLLGSLGIGTAKD